MVVAARYGFIDGSTLSRSLFLTKQRLCQFCFGAEFPVFTGKIGFSAGGGRQESAGRQVFDVLVLTSFYL
jgi:hypothetical protein